MITLLRLLLWPLARPRRALITLGALSAGAGWWTYGDAILRWLGLGRPPERTIEMDLRAAEPEVREEWLDRYGDLDPAGLAAASAELRRRFESEADAAFQVVRARGEGERTAFARTGRVPVPAGSDPTLLTRVVLDPAEVPGSDPVALTLELGREEWGAVYALRDELDWLEARVLGAQADAEVETSDLDVPAAGPELLEAGSGG